MKLQDLKRGMRCTFRNGDKFTVSHVYNGAVFTLFRTEGYWRKTTLKEDLMHARDSDLDVIKVEDITLDGYETIWEREEQKYYLRLPKDFVGEELLYTYYLNYHKLEKKHYFDTKLETTISQTQFTQAEIDKLDTTHLIKEEVVE